MTLMLVSPRQIRQLALSILAAAVGYFLFALWGGWRDVVAAIGAVGAGGVVVALLLSLVNYGLRFTRWQLYLRRLGLELAWQPSLRIYLTGFALTTTPGKAGEMLRGLFLKQHGLSYSRGVAAFVSERLSDLLAIVLLTLLGLSVLPNGQSFIGIGAAVVIGGVLVMVYGGTRPNPQLEIHTGRLARGIRHVREMLNEARLCHSPRLLVISTLLSLIAWSAEAWAFYLILSWIGFETALAFAFSVYALAMLAGALSFLPGGLGGAEAVMTGLLIWAGMDSPQAIAATVITRLATLWFAVLLGIIALGMRSTSTPE
ncbi:MAG: flippase-like domain-containing protein [Hydrogenophilales bacterium]|nr:flippase-like domain-containing protein [Hydrogenophilales bacterium]